MTAIANVIYTVFTFLATRLAWLPPLATRLCVGWVFLISGWGKLQNLPQTVTFFQELGIPQAQVQAPFVAGVEFVGGLLLIIGLATRFAAVPLMIIMAVALMTAKREDFTNFSDLSSIYEFLYIVLLAWLVVYGAGALSLDHLIRRRFLGRKSRRA